MTINVEIHFKNGICQIIQFETDKATPESVAKSALSGDSIYLMDTQNKAWFINLTDISYFTAYEEVEDSR